MDDQFVLKITQRVGAAFEVVSLTFADKETALKIYSCIANNITDCLTQEVTVELHAEQLIDRINY